MDALPEFAVVHLGPGVFETRGLGPNYLPGRIGWTVRKGQKLLGSGVGLTVLRLMHATDPRGHRAVGHSHFGSGVSQVDGFVAMDFTVDCHLRAQAHEPTAKAAMAASGRHLRLRRVRAIDFGTHTGAECFVFAGGGTAPLAEGSVDARHEDCIVEQPAPGGVYTATLLGFGAGEDDTFGIQQFNRACAVRHCYANGDFTDRPVSVRSVTFIDGLARVQTREPHSRQAGDWVIVTGAVESGFPSGLHFNGSFRVVNRIDASTFEYAPYRPNSSDVLTAPTGDIFLGRSPGHFLPVHRIEKETNDSRVARLTTVVEKMYSASRLVSSL